MAAPPPPPSDRPTWLDQAPTWLAPPPPAAAEEPPATAEPQPPPPAWTTPAPKSSRLWIYLAGAMVLIVLIGGGVFVRGQIAAMQAANDQPQIAATSPTPFLSDYERADRFLNIDLTPSMAAAVGPLQAVGSTCSTSALVPSCKDALIATSKAMIATDEVISKGDIPICIAREVLQLKNDWEGMQQGVSLAISGFNASSKDLYLQGMVKFAEIAQFYKPDTVRITAAEKTCSKVAR